VIFAKLVKEFMTSGKYELVNPMNTMSSHLSGNCSLHIPLQQFDQVCKVRSSQSAPPVTTITFSIRHQVIVWTDQAQFAAVNRNEVLSLSSCTNISKDKPSRVTDLPHRFRTLCKNCRPNGHISPVLDSCHP
jgi:hypothetical protein